MRPDRGPTRPGTGQPPLEQGHDGRTGTRDRPCVKHARTDHACKRGPNFGFRQTHIQRRDPGIDFRDRGIQLRQLQRGLIDALSGHMPFGQQCRLPVVGAPRQFHLCRKRRTRSLEPDPVGIEQSGIQRCNDDTGLYAIALADQNRGDGAALLEGERDFLRGFELAGEAALKAYGVLHVQNLRHNAGSGGGQRSVALDRTGAERPMCHHTCADRDTYERQGHGNPPDPGRDTTPGRVLLSCGIVDHDPSRSTFEVSVAYICLRR